MPSATGTFPTIMKAYGKLTMPPPIIELIIARVVPVRVKEFAASCGAEVEEVDDF